MTRGIFSLRALRAVAIDLRVPLRAMALALFTACALATPAAAMSHGPKYGLSVVEGETTLPEYHQIAGTSGHAEPNSQVAVSIIRNGTTVYRDVGEQGGAWLSQAPQVGDIVTLESPLNNLVASMVYDGLPTMDPTVCAGSTNFSGENSPGDTIEGSYVTESLKYDPYGQVDGFRETGFGEAQVKALSGTAFGGTFLTPLSLGQTVAVTESLKTQLAGEATYTYTSENQRPVGACPVPPPVFSPPPPPVLQGLIARLFSTGIHKFLRLGARDEVTINQPGTVSQDLYLAGGKLPAFAASRHHKKLPPALLLARGSTTAKSAGTVSVLLHLTAKGRRKLKSASRIKAMLITTLRSTSGAKYNLARRAISLHR